MWGRCGAPLRAVPLLLLLLVVAVAAEETNEAPICQAVLTGLKIDEPRGPPQRSIGGLPFCDQFSCSCCNRSHAMSLARAHARATIVAGAEEGLSPACARAMRLMACRPCDPEVGTGLKPGVCRSTCDEAFAACQEDFFAFSEASGTIVPCSGALVCSQLRDQVVDGEEYCKAIGLPVSDEQPCYDGKANPKVDARLCAASDAEIRLQQRRRRQQQQQRRPGSLVAAAVAWLRDPRNWARGIVLLGALLFGAAALQQQQQRRRRAPLPPQLQRRQAPAGSSGNAGGGGDNGLLSADERRQVLLQAARVREAAARARTTAPKP